MFKLYDKYSNQLNKCGRKKKNVVREKANSEKIIIRISKITSHKYVNKNGKIKGIVITKTASNIKTGGINNTI